MAKVPHETFKSVKCKDSGGYLRDAEASAGRVVMSTEKGRGNCLRLLLGGHNWTVEGGDAIKVY